MVGAKVEYGILEQVGSVQRAQKGSTTIISLWGHPENTVSGYSGLWRPLGAYKGQTKQTMAEIKVMYGILEHVGSVQQAQEGYIM